MEIIKDNTTPKRPFMILIDSNVPAKYLCGESGRIRRFATRESANKALHAALNAQPAAKPAKKAESVAKPPKGRAVKVKVYTGTEHPTTAMYEPLQMAFDLFNKEFFDNELPRCLITLNESQPRVIAHYQADAFVSTAAGEKFVDEIAFNPDHLARGEELTLSTLLHEAVHAWRNRQPKPATKGYHDKLWAEKMKQCGLQPRAHVNPGEKPKEVGHKVTHDIMEGGRFQEVAQGLIARGWRLHWVGRSYVADVAGGIAGGAGTDGRTEGDAPKKPSKKQTRAKFVCPSCKQAAWAKPGAQLICGSCDAGARMDVQGADSED